MLIAAFIQQVEQYQYLYNINIISIQISIHTYIYIYTLLNCRCKFCLAAKKVKENKRNGKGVKSLSLEALKMRKRTPFLVFQA